MFSSSTCWDDVVAYHAASPRLAFGIGIVAAQLWFVIAFSAVLDAAYRHGPARWRISNGRQAGREGTRWLFWALVNQAVTCATAFTAGDILKLGVRLTPTTNDGGAGAGSALLRAVVSVILMSVLSDCGLYWGHRLLHYSPWLWRHVHSVHHQVRDPTALSILLIHPLDTLIQQAAPMTLAALIVQPTLAAFYAFTCFHLAETTAFHSGLRPGWLSALAFAHARWVPGRASIAHHDNHHKYCNHGGRATNLGEALFVWDWAFGTLQPASLTRRGQKK